MTAETFLMLLAIFSTATSLVTEAIKKTLDSAGAKYATNIIVLISAALVGGVGTSIFYIINGVEWSALNVVSVFLMIVANWLGATLGYDKVTQMFTQLRK